jgi:hypothetical protein
MIKPKAEPKPQRNNLSLIKTTNNCSNHKNETETQKETKPRKNN